MTDYNPKDVEWLLAAAERVKRYLQARIDGKYFAPNEDISAGRELAEAILQCRSAEPKS